MSKDVRMKEYEYICINTLNCPEQPKPNFLCPHRKLHNWKEDSCGIHTCYGEAAKCIRIGYGKKKNKTKKR